jgi:hypothetical protein
LNDSDGITYLPVTSIYQLESAGLRPVGEFTYTLKVATVSTTITDADDYTIYSGLQFANGDDGALTDESSVTIKFGSDSSTTAEFTETKIAEIDLSKLNVKDTTTGVYRYTLTQTTTQQNKNGKYADENTEYTVDLYVNNGKILHIKVWTVEETDDGLKYNKSNPSFMNTVVNDDVLYVTNFIDYDMAKADETFEFQVTIPDKGIGGDGIELDAGTPIYATITSQDGSHDSRTFTFYVVENGSDTYTETITNEDGTETTVTHDNKVKLYDGDKLSITGLPANMKYTVTMVDANDREYTSTRAEYEDFTPTVNTPSVWKVEENYPTIVNASTDEVTTDGGGTVVGKNYTNNLGNIHHVEYVSTKNITSTGVSMDSVPYLVMFVAAAAIAVLAVAKKKTNR